MKAIEKRKLHAYCTQLKRDYKSYRDSYLALSRDSKKYVLAMIDKALHK